MSILIALVVTLSLSAVPPERTAVWKPFPKPARDRIAAEQSNPFAVLKLAEGSGVRLRGDQLVLDPAFMNDRLSRSGIDRAVVPARLAELKSVLGRYHVRVTKIFSRSEAELDAYRAEGEKKSGRELGDQNLFFLLEFPKADEAMVDALVALNALDLVEHAAPRLKIAQPPADIPPTTPNFTPNQGYRGSAPVGIGVDAMSLVPGGLGEWVIIADIEYGWTTNHEDLPAPLIVVQNSNLFGPDHGTAVLGEMVGIDNGYGVTGIAPEADTVLVGHYNDATGTSNVANAIDLASIYAGYGNVILMETQTWCPQPDLCPSEYELDVFTAIQNATAVGRIVVEAAGNGGLNLDDPRFNGRFNPNLYDSGAIMVGAGSSTSPHNTLGFSNFGARVNVQGWGQNVTTTGYGDLFGNGDLQQEYTSTFNGTSSASPIVAGAAAVVQGVRYARDLTPLTSQQMRAELIAFGTAQGTGGHIGPLPNVASTVGAIALHAPVVTATGTASSVTVTWQEVAGSTWYQLERRACAGCPWVVVYTDTTPSFVDTGLLSGKTYLYRAQTFAGPNYSSGYGNRELATTISYTDPNIVAQSTPVKAKHIIEVRTAINSICTFAGSTLCPSAPYAGNDLSESFMQTQVIAASHFTTAKNWITSLRSAVTADPAVFQETPATGALIKRIHMLDLRNGAN